MCRWYSQSPIMATASSSVSASPEDSTCCLAQARCAPGRPTPRCSAGRAPSASAAPPKSSGPLGGDASYPAPRNPSCTSRRCGASSPRRTSARNRARVRGGRLRGLRSRLRSLRGLAARGRRLRGRLLRGLRSRLRSLRRSLAVRGRQLEAFGACFEALDAFFEALEIELVDRRESRLDVVPLRFLRGFFFVLGVEVLHKRRARRQYPRRFRLVRLNARKRRCRVARGQVLQRLLRVGRRGFVARM